MRSISRKIVDAIAPETDPLEIGKRQGALADAYAAQIKRVAANTASRAKPIPEAPDPKQVEALALNLLAGDDPAEVAALPGENEIGRDLRILRALTRAVELAQSKGLALRINRAEREASRRRSEWRELMRERVLAVAALQSLNRRALDLAKEIIGTAPPEAAALPMYESVVQSKFYLGIKPSWPPAYQKHTNFSIEEFFKRAVTDGVVTEAELADIRKGESQ